MNLIYEGIYENLFFEMKILFFLVAARTTFQDLSIQDFSIAMQSAQKTAILGNRVINLQIDYRVYETWSNNTIIRFQMKLRI